MINRQREILENISESLEIIKPFALKKQVPSRREYNHLSVVWEALNEVYSNKKNMILDIGCVGCLSTAINQAHNHFVYHLGKEETIEEKLLFEYILNDARNEYKIKFGKFPHHKMKMENIILKLKS